jgi:hypothetical protein
MSGISPTSSVTSTLSAVGQSLLDNGSAPVATPAAPANTSANSSYTDAYAAFNTYNTQELLYASFLSPADSLANTDAVLNQAAQLLDNPSSTSSASSSTSTSTDSSTSTATDPLDSLPSVASILSASDNEANQTLTAYGNAPAGSSIIDFQA